MRVGNIFSRVCLSVRMSVRVSVCLSVQAITFELLYIFGMKVYVDHIKVKFEYQGHWVKVKVM